MYRETLHTSRYLQTARLAAANPPPRKPARLRPRLLVGRMLVRAGERILAAGLETPLGSRV